MLMELCGAHRIVLNVLNGAETAAALTTNKLMSYLLTLAQTCAAVLHDETNSKTLLEKAVVAAQQL